MNKTKILTWAVVLLLILNISIIGTIFYKNKNDQKESSSLVLDNTNSKRLTGQFFRQVLNFDNAQMESFREANHILQPKVRVIIANLDSLKKQNLAELNSPDPDLDKLNQIATEIGHQHNNLKIATNDFYLMLKKVCNETQQKQLNEVFSPLYNTENSNEEILPLRGKNRRNRTNDTYKK